MSACRRDLTDDQWELLDSLIPEPPRRKDGRGRPWRGRREVLNGVLFISGSRGSPDQPGCKILQSLDVK